MITLHYEYIAELPKWFHYWLQQMKQTLEISLHYEYVHAPKLFHYWLQQMSLNPDYSTTLWICPSTIVIPLLITTNITKPWWFHYYEYVRALYRRFHYWLQQMWLNPGYFTTLWISSSTVVLPLLSTSNVTKPWKLHYIMNMFKWL